MDRVDALIVGGQGTFNESSYFTEFPDRELGLEYVMKVRDIVDRFRYNVVICSGGYTQKETPILSEAESFLNIWAETMTKPACSVVLDNVALDSAENVIFGLMTLRLKEPGAKLQRIGFYSQWHFKKPRMTSLAADLGIDKRFYFHGYADADHANAGEAAKAGELGQFEKMKNQRDFLLRGEEWTEKRVTRHRHPSISFAERDLELRTAFPAVFAALKQLERTSVDELTSEGPEMDAREAIRKAQQRKILTLQAAFSKEVLQERQDISQRAA
jgi:hypothetical protein